MSGSSGSGVIVYAKHLERVSRFYERVLSSAILHADADHTILQAADAQIVVHAIPPQIASTIAIDDPPQPREEQAIKPYFTVASLAAAGDRAVECGGLVCGPVWHCPEFRAQNVCDPEGNIVQLRDSTA